MSPREQAYDAVDATVFSSDMLYQPEELAVFKSYLERWTRAVNEHSAAPAPTAQPAVPPTVTLDMVKTLERNADLIDETRKRLDAVGTRLEQYQTEIAPTAQPVQAQGDNP